MTFTLPYSDQDIAHLTIGTHIRSLITFVHDPQHLKFNIRIISEDEFRLTDIIENRQYKLEGYNVTPSNPIFGLGINGKVFRSILVPPMGNDAYLIDLGCKMLIREIDPIYRLPLFVQAIPGMAICCQYADPPCLYTEPEKFLGILAQIRDGAVCVLCVVDNANSILQVRLANEPTGFLNPNKVHI